MSYDLAVFEKSRAPAEAQRFLAWYAKQTEWDGDQDYSDITRASLDLQRFFHQIRLIFPPMNGTFAPSDEELSARPDLEERLCDYCIGEDIIYLSLACSVADSAYDLVKRAAYFAGVGFFSPSDGGESLAYFESRCPMLLEGGWFQAVSVSDFGSVRTKLGEMTAKERSYLYLTDPVGSYIQVGGFGDIFTVERRVYTDCMSYTHQKAGYLSAGESDEEGCVEIAGNQVRVKRHQILSGGTVQQLFWDFLRQTETADQIGWTEIQL